MPEYEGLIEAIRYNNVENGYTVFDFSVTGEEEDGDYLTCVAYLHSPQAGERLKISGNFVNHPNYGKQFSVESYEKLLPTGEAAIERYLASGVIKGIGERLAARIVKQFGPDTLKVMEEAPEKLTAVKGIPMEKALNIGVIFREQADLRRAMLFLQEFQIGPALALKIYNRYRDNTLNMIKTNPYCLADDINGVGFKTADEIAFKVGIEPISPYRSRAGIRYVLSLSTGKGHVYLPRNVLIQECAQLLNIDRAYIEDSFSQLQFEKSIIQETVEDGVNVYLSSMHYAESYVARKLVELSLEDTEVKVNAEEKIKELEKTGIQLAAGQAEAVKMALKAGVMVITGGPGTGKTTTINSVISILNGYGSKIELAAPTGRAAKRMTEATGMEAKTIHRLLVTNFLTDDITKQSFEKNQENPIEADVVIIDETSMVDISLMSSLLKAVAPGTKLILVGDVDQLPSVGPGNVLKDIINSGCVPVVRLVEIFRQAQESAIVMNAHRINNGLYPVLNEVDKDFFFIKRINAEEVIDTLLDLVTKRLPSYVNCDKLKEIQVLTPMRKSPLGVHNLNQLLQKRLNPPSKQKNEKEFRSIIFREGDKVMQNKNNYSINWQLLDHANRKVEEGTGIFNGDEGIIQRIDDREELVTVLFEDSKLVKYEYAQLEELELSYAITIHKSQGSEYRVVVLPLHSGPALLMSRNLLYTAVTRAKSLAVIVGQPDMLKKMVDNNREDRRYSALHKKIISMRSLL